MMFYPQLPGPASFQYTLTKVASSRSISCSFGDGRVQAIHDLGSGFLLWRMPYRALTLEERRTLENFFHSVEGRLGTFTFADPCGNLVTHSGDLNHDCWSKGALVSIASGNLDPLGHNSAWHLTNGSQADASVSQTLSVSGAGQYCWSVFARSAIDSMVILEIDNGAEQRRRQFTTSGHWLRLSLSFLGSATTEQVRFGIRQPAGTAIDIYGPQVEIQAAPGCYRETTDSGGVFSNARFDMDELWFSAEGPNSFSTEVTVRTPVPD